MVESVLFIWYLDKIGKGIEYKHGRVRANFNEWSLSFGDDQDGWRTHIWVRLYERPKGGAWLFVLCCRVPPGLEIVPRSPCVRTSPRSMDRSGWAGTNCFGQRPKSHFIQSKQKQSPTVAIVLWGLLKLDSHVPWRVPQHDCMKKKVHLSIYWLKLSLKWI